MPATPAHPSENARRSTQPLRQGAELAKTARSRDPRHREEGTKITQLELLVLRDIRLLEAIDRALDEVVVLRLQI